MNAKNFKGFLITAIVVASSLSVLALNISGNSITKRLTIPFTFAAGKPIKASDLNANFAAVKKTLENHDHTGETWDAGPSIGLSVSSRSGISTLYSENTGTGPGVLGFAVGSQAGGVKGINDNGVGVWGKSTKGNGGYFETASDKFPALIVRQFGVNNIIEALGPGDNTPEFWVNSAGRVFTRGDIYTNGIFARGSIVAGGVVYSQGVVLTSDRNAKQNFSSVNALGVLEKVAAMPITRWNYKADASSIAHVGPMAQDFHAAFGLNGTDDKHISVIDEQGIALAAIQGLNQKLESTNAALNVEKAENAKLRSSLTDLEKRLAALERK
jgi:Chaperone of endosialidase